MRARWLLLSLSVAACYSAQPPTGAPCDPTTNICPSGQSCVMEGGVFVCSAGAGDDGGIASDATAADAPPATDAPPDGRPGDRDGDGVDDAVDNCALVANAEQWNEDGDSRGDACDGCPPIATAAPTDGDGDGVDDDCDPNPMVAGDVITMFEGFHTGMPPSWTEQGTWTAVNGSVSTNAGGGGSVFIAPPFTTQPRATASAGIVPGAPTSLLQGLGVTIAANPGHTAGANCGLYTGTSANDRQAGLVALNGSVITAGAYNWSDATPYTLTITRDASAFECTIAGANTSAYNGNYASNGPQLHIGTRGIPLRVDWVMYIESP